jgi:hypothetical protein
LRLVLISGRQEDNLIALAGSGAGKAQVGYPELINVHGDTDEGPGRQLDDHGAVGEVNDDRGVGGVGVEGKADVLRLVSSVPKDLVGDDADLLVALEDGVAGDGGIEEAVGFNGTTQVGIVVGSLRVVSRRKSAFEGVAVVGVCRLRCLLLLFAFVEIKPGEQLWPLPLKPNVPSASLLLVQKNETLNAVIANDLHFTSRKVFVRLPKRRGA